MTPLDVSALRRLGPYVASAVREEVATAARPKASHNGALAASAFRLGTLLGALGDAGEAQRESIEAALLDASAQNGSLADDGEGEARSTVTRAVRAGMRKPRVLPGSEWSQPVPLDDRELPGFPVETLPAQLRPYVNTLAEELQVSPSLTASLVLAAFSAAFNGKVTLQATDSWREGVNLFLIAVARSGGGKSPAFGAIRAPIERRERVLRDAAKKPVADAVKEREVKLEQVKALRREIAAARLKHEPNADREAELSRLELALHTFTIPPEPVLVSEDVTPERVVSLLHEQGGRLALLSSEAEPLSLMSRYTEGGAVNMDVYLKAWSGERLVVDRVKDRARVVVAAARLVLACTVQPVTVADLMDPRTRLLARGFVGRVLWVTPEDRIGVRNMRAAPMPAHVGAEYDSVLTRALTLDTSEEPDGCITLRLSPAAWECFVQFQESIEPLAAEHARLGFMSDYLSKLRSNVLRLAALLHSVDACYGLERGEAFPLEVTEETMRCAVALGRFFLAHAEAVYRPAGDALAARLLRWVGHTERRSFTRREVQRHVLGNRKDVGGALDDALSILIECGWIREREPERAGNVPRVFDVSPWFATPERDATEQEPEP